MFLHLRACEEPATAGTGAKNVVRKTEHVHVSSTELKTTDLAETNKITEAIIGAAIDVHRALGPGLLESACAECVAHELSLRGVSFEREVPLPVRYKGVNLDCGYRLDLLVEKGVVVELKALDALLPIHEAQLLMYLRLGGWRVGLLINFNVPVLKEGIRRRVL
jgi:GxxExxY protein